MIPETDTNQSAPRLDRCLCAIVRDTKQGYVQVNYRTKRSSCSKEKPRRKRNVENVQIFPYACFVWLPWTIGLFVHRRFPPQKKKKKKKLYMYIRIWVLLEAVMLICSLRTKTAPPSPPKKKDGSWRNKTLVKRASLVHDVTNSQTAWHEMAALTAVFETFKRWFFTNQIIIRLKTAVKSFFPILIDMARDATSLRSL